MKSDMRRLSPANQHHYEYYVVDATCIALIIPVAPAED